MSSDQPRPGSGGEPPENDPFLKKPQEPPVGGSPYGGGMGGDAGGGAPPPPPPGGAVPPLPPPGGTPPPPYSGDPYGSAPYGDNPYGDQYGAADPLAGMPPLAGRGRRLVARIIDGILIAVPVSLIMTAAMGGIDYTNAQGNFDLGVDTGKQTAIQIVTMLVYFIYEGLMLTSRGQTVGKRVMKIRVAMLSNGAIPAGQAGWFRAATYTLPEIVPCCGFVFWLVNVLWCTWDKPYQQCLHDKAAKTVVVSAA
jgi:uncharacterized RDD family membrane protein YckC